MPRDYSKWKTVKDISIVDMQLDTKNPRMPDSLEITQSAVISIMEKKYNVIDIARSIGLHGYIPRENIIITYEGDKPVVLEGNRRITALKLINNPSLASENREEYISIRDKFDDINIISYPAVLIAPSRRDADPLIIDKHTENTEIPWKPIIQARLYKRKKEEYGSISNKELASELGTTEAKIIDSFRRLVLYEEALKVAKGTCFIEKVEDPEGFEITTLERIMNLKDVQTRLCFTISESKVETKDLDKFRAVLKFIIKWMFEAPGEKDFQRITSRTANTGTQIMRYVKLAIKKVQDSVENNEGHENEDDIESSENPNDKDNFTSSVVGDSEEDKSKNPKPRNRKPAIINDLPISFEPTVMGTGNINLYSEISSLKFSNYPNIIVILTRIFLERIIRRFLFLKRIKKIPVVENNESKMKKIENATFKEILTFLVKEEELELDDEIIKCIKRFSNGTYEVSASLSTLNNMIHFQNRTIGSEKAREIWAELTPIMEYFANNHAMDKDTAEGVVHS